MTVTWDNGFHERHTAYYAAVGYLCQQWNVVESLYYGIPCDIMKLSRGYRKLLFRHMGTTTIAEFLSDYAAEHLSEKSQKQISHVNTYVDRCRQNRNLIVHGIRTTEPNSAQDAIRRNPDRKRKTVELFAVGLNDIRRVCEECDTAGGLVVRLQFHFEEHPADIVMRLAGADRINSILYGKPDIPRLLVDQKLSAEIANRDPPLH